MFKLVKMWGYMFSSIECNRLQFILDRGFSSEFYEKPTNRKTKDKKTKTISLKNKKGQHNSQGPMSRGYIID